jgi:uncharacterized protein (UPF0548 family)
LFLLRKPTDVDVVNFINTQKDLPYSYSAIGATASQPPSGFTVDRNRIQLGEGKQTFARAVAALSSWKQFELGWVTVRPKGKPLTPGTTVAVRAHTFGFAYGTLPAHVEQGEERFLIEWNADNSVWYELYAFSRPQHPLVKLGSRLARMLQKRFVKESLQTMRYVVSEAPD